MSERDDRQDITYVDAVVMLADNNFGVNGVGYYDDEVVRTAAGWRIARRRSPQGRLRR
jgi:hypothetical protein